MKPSQRTLQELRTPLAPDEVLERAKAFFTRHNAIYSAFQDMEGPGWVSFRGQGGEELVISAQPHEGATRVTGGTYLFDMQLSRFFTTLSTVPGADARDLAPPPAEASA
ncbi:MAG: hypothetical protein ACYC1S_16110 [Gemmatimonadaceae bacterium]